MANVGSVLIQFRADADAAIKDINKLTGSLGDIDKDAGNAGRSFDKFKKAAVVGAAAAAAALAAAAAAAVDFAKAAAEDWREAGKLEDTLSRLPGVTEEMIAANDSWIRSMRIATGVNKNELRQAVGDLTYATGDLTRAQELSALAWDAAVGSGKGYEEIVEALIEATGGETGALVEQFQWLEKNEDGTLDAASALKQLEKRFKGAADEAANRDPWQRILVIWDELKVALGQFIIPLLEDLSDWFASPTNQKKLQEWIDKVRDFSYEVGVKAADAIKKLIDWLQSPDGKKAMRDFVTSAENIASAVASISRALGPVIGLLGDLFDLWSKLPAPLRGLSGGKFPGLSAAAAPQLVSASTRTSGQPTAAPTARPVTVTDDQLAGAITRLLMRQDGRQGRMVAIV